MRIPEYTDPRFAIGLGGIAMLVSFVGMFFKGGASAEACSAFLVAGAILFGCGQIASAMQQPK